MANVVIQIEVPEEQAMAFLEAGKMIIAQMEASVMEAQQGAAPGNGPTPELGGDAEAAGLLQAIQAQQPSLPGGV